MTQTELQPISVDGAGAADARARNASSSRCAAASPGTVFARRCGGSGTRIPLEVHEVPSGTEVLDWTVPDEWNIRGAHIDGPDGSRVVDFDDSNLHVVGYSEPVRETMTLDDLRSRLHTHDANPAWIPYRTSYYTRTWGFCLSRDRLEELGDGLYDVVIDSTLGPGSLTYGECFLPGETDDEVLLTSHVCHPSLANDNLSGVALLAELAETLASMPRRLSYRFLFIPGTIGAITWLARNDDAAARVVAGLVFACVGDSGAADVQAEQARRRPRRPCRCPRRLARGTDAYATSLPGAGTSASSTLRASISRSAA